MIAEATRVRLLWALLERELSVNQLAETVGKPATGVSQHLAKLRLARLVRTRREGTQVFYRVENEHVRQLIRDAIYHAEHATLGIPDHHRGSSPLVHEIATEPALAQPYEKEKYYDKST